MRVFTILTIALVCFSAIADEAEKAVDREPGSEKKGKLMPHAPISPCWNALKNLSTLSGWGGLVEGKTYIVPAQYTVDYAYNEKTKKHVPVLIQVKDGKIHVTSPSGTTITEGKSCSFLPQTSDDLVAEWIENSKKTFADFKKFDPESVGKMNAEAKKNYADSSAASENQYRSILQKCADENLGRISAAATSALSQNWGAGDTGKAGKAQR